MTGKTLAQNRKAFLEDWWAVCIILHIKNQFSFQHPCPLNKQTKVFLLPNIERFFSWLLNEVLADMSKTETSCSGLAVNILFKRSTCLWAARYLMKSNHLGNQIAGERCYRAFWELLHMPWRNPCSFPNDVISLRRKEENVSCARARTCICQRKCCCMCCFCS